MPFEAYNIIIGVALHSIGQIWVDELDLQIVDPYVPITGKLYKK